MSIKVALFFEDDYWEEFNESRYSAPLRLISGFGDENLKISEIGRNEVIEHVLSGQRFDCDVAVIHMSYEVRTEKYFTYFAPRVIQKLLPIETRRLVISKEKTGSVSNDIMSRMEADHYFPEYAIHGEFLRVLALGRVDSSELASRGHQIMDEEGVVIKRVVGLAPDRDIYDDRAYFKGAKER